MDVYHSCIRYCQNLNATKIFFSDSKSLYFKYIFFLQKYKNFLLKCQRLTALLHEAADLSHQNVTSLLEKEHFRPGQKGYRSSNNQAVFLLHFPHLQEKTILGQPCSRRRNTQNRPNLNLRPRKQPTCVPLNSNCLTQQ